MERLIALDTETTGIKTSEGHRIIEIGAVEIINREITNVEFQQYLQPKRNVGESFNIHGINDKFLKDKPEFVDIAEKFIDFIKDSTLIIHNAAFDLEFLNNELKLIKSKIEIQNICKIIDTLELSKKQHPGAIHSLDALCRRFEVDASSRTIHGALIDAKILSQVYLAMTGGQKNLFQDDNIQTNKNKDIKIINKNINNKIKIIYADEQEQELHKNYFKNII